MFITPTMLSFGITTSRTVYNYAKGCRIEKTRGKYKDYEFFVQKDYMNKHLCSTLICINKAGKWIKSKLKYFDNGRKTKILRSEARDKVV